ncbi:MAG: polysaccharide deacetylase family protein [archaeon]
MKLRNIIITFFILILIYFIILLWSRTPLIVDDVYDNSCIEIVEKADIVYVIPFFEGRDISENNEWCESMIELNKTFGLHGISHEYHEFLGEIEEEELVDAISNFEYCFGYKPELFRPPYNKISEENSAIVLSQGIKIYKKPYFLHPYCHCNPGSWMKLLNWVILC